MLGDTDREPEEGGELAVKVTCEYTEELELELELLRVRVRRNV